MMNDQIPRMPPVNHDFAPDPMCGLEAVYHGSDNGGPDYTRPIVGWITLIHFYFEDNTFHADDGRSIMAAVMVSDGSVESCDDVGSLIEVRPVGSEVSSDE